MAVDKAKHAFGASSRIAEALSNGVIDAFDILFLDGDTDSPKVGWVDRNGKIVIVPTAEDEVVVVGSLPQIGKVGVIYVVGEEAYLWNGAKFVSVTKTDDISKLEDRVAAMEAQVSSVDGKVSAMETKVGEVESKVSAVEEQSNAIGERVSSVESKVAEVEVELPEVKAKVSDVEAAVASVDGKVAEVETQLKAKADAEQVAADIAQAKVDAVADANAYADKQAAAVLDKCLGEKYEIISTPKGTLVDYRDKEIRVMVPAGTQFAKQSVGATGNANMYYMGFKAYAPEGAVSFKEDDLATIEDQTMYYFEGNDFAGTDKYGRKYSIVWLALAVYDEASDTWSYFGEKSSTERYIGWYYSVEWYDADGVVIASDRIRINLSNETCHSEIKPFYMSDIEVEIKKYADEIIDAKIEEVIEEVSEIPVVEF